MRISVRTDPANPATEIGTTDLLEHQYLRDAAGNPVGPTLQDAIMAGQVDPGNLVTVRELVNNAGPADVDTSVYSGPLSQYTITRNADGSVTVCDSVSVAAVAAGGVIHEAVRGDGCDILWRIERAAVRRPDGEPGSRDRTRGHDDPTLAAGLAFPSTTVATTAAARTVTVSNTGTGPLSISGLSLTGANAADFAISSTTCLSGAVAAGGNCTINVTFTPSAAGARSASLLIADNAGGSPQSMPLTGTGATPPPAATFVFGTQTVQPKADSNAAGVAEAFKVASPSTGSVTNLRVFVDAGSTASTLVAALYSNSATNHPATRLTTGTLAAPVAGQFNAVTVPSVGVTAGTTYWIAILGPAGTLRFRDQGAVGAGSSEVSATTGLSAMPATWTSGASFTDGNLSAWAAGTVTSTPPPPPPGLSVLVGNGTTEVKVDTNPAGKAEAFKAVAATTGSVSALRIFLDATSAAPNVVIGLYNNSATNHPGTLLTTGTITAPVANAQNSVSVAPAAVTAGQTYWVAVLAPSGTIKFRDHAAVGANASETSASATLAVLPNTWTTGAAFTDGNISAVGLG